MPHLHEAKTSDLLLHSPSHTQHGLFCKLISSVETDLGLGHLEQLSKGDAADELIVQVEAQPQLLSVAVPELVRPARLTASPKADLGATDYASILPDPLIFWGGGRRGPPSMFLSFC